MYIYDAIENSYKNGYKSGYEAGKRDVSVAKWIQTNKRTPTKADADEEGNVFAIYEDGKKKIIVNWEDANRFKEYISYWMHIPEFPKELK